MMDAFTCLPAAKALWQSPTKNWSIEQYIDHNNKPRLALCKDAFYTYFPTVYDFKPRFSDESIGWDTVIPPAYVREVFIKRAWELLITEGRA